LLSSQDSGAGTILGQEGGQDQKRQSLQCKIRFFAEIGLLFVPKTSVKKIKIKKGLHRIWSFGPKLGVL